MSTAAQVRTLPTTVAVVIEVATINDEQNIETELFARLPDDPTGQGLHWLSFADGGRWPVRDDENWTIKSMPVVDFPVDRVFAL